MTVPPKAPAAQLPSITRAKAKYVRSYGAGRVCSVELCSTGLSTYNNGTVCWSHADQRRFDRTTPPSA